jgi:hypothetical protein
VRSGNDETSRRPPRQVSRHVIDVHMLRKDVRAHPSHARQAGKRDLAELRQHRQEREPVIADVQTLVDLDALERRYAAQELETAVCDQ